MHVCIIGAGASGLAAGKYLLEKNCNFTCDILERNEELGGTWYYTDDVGTDKYGYPVYACMYKNLRTNLPKEVMCYSNYKYPEQDQSYISQEEVLQYLKNFAKQFNLAPLIKFSTLVKEIHCLPNNRWNVTSVHIPTQVETTQEYDAVIVCSGHFNVGSYPQIPGRETFTGKQLHSHDYRNPEPYKGKKILIIGAGPSGLDLTAILSKHAQSVIISHHANQPLTIEFPANVMKKPDVTRITETGVDFSDGTSAELDTIIYCTGYKYYFPFLSSDTKLGVEDDVFVTPLYKHIINIEHPTMALIGIPSTACSIPMYDLQIRYYVEYLNGAMQLPSKEAMYEDLNADIEKRKEMGLPKKKWHLMNVDFVWDYYKSLADAAHIENTWPSIVKLRLAAAKEIGKNLFEYRKDRYRIVDKENYIKLN